MDKRVRQAVVERSEGFCECCSRWVGADGTLDHFWGRAKAPETVETCWFLCWDPCHFAKGQNDPSARVWVERFQVFSALHGHAEQVKKCQLRLEWISAKGTP